MRHRQQGLAGRPDGSSPVKRTRGLSGSVSHPARTGTLFHSSAAPSRKGRRPWPSGGRGTGRDEASFAPVGALGRITHARARQIAAVRVPVQQLAELAVFGLFPVVIPLAMAAYLTGAWGAGLLVIDFHGLWYASRDVLHGHSPYLFHHDY